MNAKTRKLGTHGPEVLALGLGAMGMSEFYGQRDDQQSLATLHRALELGINFLDTGDFYGVGHNEELISHVLKGQRDKVTLSLKFGAMRAPGQHGQIGWGPVNTRPEFIRSSVVYSLQRLKTDYIDLYYPARVDQNVPIEETVGALGDLVKEGVIRYVGLSEASPETVRKAHATHPITAVQSEYSLWSRDPEAELLPTLRELGIGYVGYAPLSRGFLTGDIKNPEDLHDFRAYLPRFQGDNFYQNLALVEKVKAMATDKGITPAQLAIAWVLAQGNDIVSIAGTKKVKYLEDNFKALQVELSAAELAEIDQMMPAGAVAGNRYDDYSMTALNG